MRTDLNLFIGIMSGTSLDGIDVALVSIENNQTKLISSLETPFTPTLKTELTKLITDQQCHLSKIGELSHNLAIAYSKAVNQLLGKANIESNQIAAIGLHGQTVFHSPNTQPAFSLQLVNASVVAEMTGICCVHNFREMDLALDGQGAPLVPPFHESLCNQLKVSDEDNLVFVNIGGIANITLSQNNTLTGFDSGPGNTLIDSFAQKYCGVDFDSNGEMAKQGTINKALLNALLKDDYFSQPKPKSTGREYFNLDWLTSFEELDTNAKYDVLATLTELTALSIAEHLYETKGTLALCGGGAKNGFLVERIAHHLSQWHVCSSDSLNINADFMEAMAFAWLAHRTLNKLPGNAPSATGAKREAILGQITFAP